MASDAMERKSILLTRQQEAESRLLEPLTSTNDQKLQVRIDGCHPKRRLTMATTYECCQCSVLESRKPFRRRSQKSKFMISSNDLFSQAASPSAIARDGTYKSLRHHHSQKRTRSSTSPLSSMLRPSYSLLFSISFVFAVVTLVNLIHPRIFVGASSTGPVSVQQMNVPLQQSNSVIQMPPSMMGASPGPAATSGKARYKTMYACEDRQLTMDCDFGSKINLIRANFGRFSITQCNEQGQLDLSTDCMSPITFRIMQERCQDKQKCSVNATSKIFGDRCPKTRKYLEVHFQCQPDPRVLTLGQSGNLDAPERVDLRNSSQLAEAAAGGLAPIVSQTTQSVVPTTHQSTTSYLQHQQSTSSQAFIPQTAASGSSSILPPNNPSMMHRQQQTSSSMMPSVIQPHQQQDDPNRALIQQQQQPMTVMNSEIMSYNHASNSEIALSKLQDPSNNREPIIVTMRHTHIDNMSNPRCVLWDQAANQWTERGCQIIETNLTHTICAFDQATSYLLVMDHMASPSPTSSTTSQSLPSSISNFNQHRQQQQPQIATQASMPQFGFPIPDILENQPIVLDQQTPIRQQSSASSSGNNNSLNNGESNNKFFSLFNYLLAVLFIAVAFMTIAFVASSLRNSSSSAGAAFKSLGNFAALSSGNGASKYKHRRQDIMSGSGPGSSLHSSNKDLLVINNSNGHQFLYAPASTTKISSSSSTHILSPAMGGQATNGQASHHQGTLHRIQQQQMYSGNGATLSSLSAAGTQSNNYYYGLMGLSPLFQQQQQQQRFNHVNQQQQLQQQIAASQSYNHQANKSTISTESANSSSSSGVESGSTSMQQQQQQQAQTQQACLVSTSGTEFNLMNGQLSGHGQNAFVAQNGGIFHQQPQPTLTMNAHYSTSGATPQHLNNMGAQNVHQMQQHQQQQQHQRQLSSQMRDHIYETVEYEKPYMSRMLLPLNNTTNEQQQFGTIGHHQHHLFQQQQIPDHQQFQQRTMTLSSRMLHDALQGQSQQQQTSAQNNKRSPAHYPQPAIIRDHQAAKTNIICSKLAQVTPQRATEVGKGSCNPNAHHDMMTIYNGNDASTTTTTAATSTSNSCYEQRLELTNGNGNKLSTDC